MANILSFHKISKEYAGRTLFKDLSFGLEEKQHIGLIGPNGAGKSTLMKILKGDVEPDSGNVARKSGLRVAYLHQIPLFEKGHTILQAIAEGLGNSDDWEVQMKALEFVSLLDLETENYSSETLVETLSGGWRKRIAIVRELAKEPDLFLLDEPTNHLDVESIEWLEGILKKANFSYIVITHDRAFLQNVTNHILELDVRNSGGLLWVEGNYADYLELKQAHLTAQLSSEEKLKNTLRRETEWLRRGPQARTTKQQARIDRAYELADEVDDLEYRNKDRKVNLDFKASEGGPKKLIEAKQISLKLGGKVLFKDFDLLISKNSRIALLGRNGAGKSSLIKSLTGEIKVDSGTVVHSDNLQVAYFQQNRESLDPNKTLRECICPAGDYVKLRDRHIHVNSYMERFLFRPDQYQSPIRKLSGGEQSRILIAQLMLQEANLLILDEPTNDLDVATLDLLQEQLESFAGAILLVTHDRYFLDNVCNEILYLNDSKIERFVGLGQWEEAFRNRNNKNPPLSNLKEAVPAPVSSQARDSSKKLSYKELREFQSMEEVIAQKEGKLQSLSEKSNDSKLSLSDKNKTFAEISQLQNEIEKLYERWAELEKKAK